MVRYYSCITSFPLKKLLDYTFQKIVLEILSQCCGISISKQSILIIFLFWLGIMTYTSVLLIFIFFFWGFDNFTLRNKYRIGNFFLINYFQKKIPVNSLKRALVGNVNCVHLRCSVTSVSSRRAHFEFNNKNMKRSLVLFLKNIFGSGKGSLVWFHFSTNIIWICGAEQPKAAGWAAKLSFWIRVPFEVGQLSMFSKFRHLNFCSLMGSSLLHITKS